MPGPREPAYAATAEPLDRSAGVFAVRVHKAAAVAEDVAAGRRPRYVAACVLARDPADPGACEVKLLVARDGHPVGGVADAVREVVYALGFDRYHFERVTARGTRRVSRDLTGCSR